MPEDTQSTVSHRSVRSARSQTGSVRSVLTTLSKKGPFHRRTTVGDDDPLETLSMADYHPPTATDEEAMSIRASMNMNNPGFLALPASVAAKWENVMDKMPSIKLPEREKAATVEDVKRRQTEDEERAHEFQMFVEEQRMLGRDINPNYHEYLMEQMAASADLEKQLGIAPPRQRQGPPPGHPANRGGPPPQPGRPGQQPGLFSRLLGPRRPAAPRRPLTLAEAEAMALMGQNRPQEQDEYGRPPRPQKQPRPAIRRLHEEESHSRESQSRRDEYEYEGGHEHDAPRMPREGGRPPARRNSSSRTPTHYDEDQYDQSYEYESYARPPPNRRGGAQRSRSQEYSRGGYGGEYEYEGGYNAEYSQPGRMHSQNARRGGGYGNDYDSYEYPSEYSNDYSYAQRQPQPQRRAAPAGPPPRRGGREEYEYGGGYGGYEGGAVAYGGQYW